MCDSKELLIDYLYNDLDASGRRTLDAHLKTCAECRGELAGLRSTRAHLASWTPPEPDFSFQIVRSRAAPAGMGSFRVSPAWGLAAAAVLVIAVAAAVANVEVRHGNDGLIVRTGWNRSASVEPDETVGATAAASASTASALTASAPTASAPTASAPTRPAPLDESVKWQAAADGLDRRLRELEAIARTQRPAVQNASTSVSDVEVLRRVREMLGQSETRQERAVAVRIAELTREFDAQRRLDLAAIDSGMARLQNTSGAEVKQYRDLIQRMYRAAAFQQR